MPVDPAVASAFGSVITLCSAESLGGSAASVAATATGTGYGIVVTVPTTTGSVSPGSTAVVTGSSPTATAQSSSTGGGDGGGFPKAAIGGIVGGVCGVLLLGAAFIFFWTRRQKRRANAPVPGTIEDIQPPEPKSQNEWDGGEIAQNPGEEVPSGRLRYPEEDLPELGESAPIGARTSRHY